MDIDWTDTFHYLFSMAEHYNNWELRRTIFAMQELVPLPDLYKWLIVTHRIPFSVKARRDEARDAFQNLRTNYKVCFSRETRIPELLIVNASTGVVADLLGRALVSLDYKERFTSDLATTTGSRMGSIDDAKVAFSRAVQRLLDIFTKTAPGNLSVYDVFTRAQLETMLSLAWTGP